MNLTHARPNVGFLESCSAQRNFRQGNELELVGDYRRQLLCFCQTTQHRVATDSLHLVYTEKKSFATSRIHREFRRLENYSKIQCVKKKFYATPFGLYDKKNSLPLCYTEYMPLSQRLPQLTIIL
jgi:hypothetical protein